MRAGNPIESRRGIVMIRGAWFCTVWAFAAAGLGMLVLHPEILLRGPGGAETPATVHLLTLGVVLGAYYPLQAALWRECFGPNRFAEALSWPLWASHGVGVALMAWGLSGEGERWALLGGHDLVPLAVVLSWIQQIVWFWKRPAGTPRALESHLPGLGLLVVVPLGVMILLDRHGADYGFYSPLTILIHMLAAAFLFVLPARSPGDVSSRPGAQMAWGGLSALALLALALSSRGFQGGLPLGLALLGGVALWVGLPDGGRWKMPPALLMARIPWALLGLFLLYGALLALRGAGAGEGVRPAALAAGGAVLFLFGIALPDALARMAAGGRSSPLSGAAWLRAGQLMATGALLIGLWVQSGVLLRVALAGYAATVAAMAAIAWTERRAGARG